MPAPGHFRHTMEWNYTRYTLCLDKRMAQFRGSFYGDTNSLNRLPADLRQKIEGVFPEVSDFNMNFVKVNDEAVIARMKQRVKV